MDVGNKMVLHGTFIFCLVVATAAMGLSKHQTEAQEFFDTIPEDEKSYFVSYSLVQALYEEENKNASVPMPNNIQLKQSNIKIPKDVHIPEHLWHKFQSMDIPPGFSHDLYSWVRKDYNMEEQHVEELLLRQIYCFPDGTCMDMDDIGNTCCPF